MNRGIVKIISVSIFSIIAIQTILFFTGILQKEYGYYITFFCSIIIGLLMIVLIRKNKNDQPSEDTE